MSSEIRVKVVEEIPEIPEFPKHGEGVCDHEAQRKREQGQEERSYRSERRNSNGGREP